MCLHRLLHLWLTNRTHETLETVYVFLEAFITEHGYAPSLREISARCFIGRSTVIHYLDRLEAQGRLSREEGKARSIVLIPTDGIVLKTLDKWSDKRSPFIRT